MGFREQIIAEEGSCFPGKTYTEVVLEPAFNEAKQQLLGPMMAINKAHLIMLLQENLITPEDAHAIANAITDLDLDGLRKCTYTGEFEDLFFQVEKQLLDKAGDIAGNLHLGRSRNDMGIAIYRMTLREKMLITLGSALHLKEHLLAFAEEHVDTLMIGYTHTQQAQPTTMAHYIMAVVDSLSRDIRRLIAAYMNCNRSSMGAAALTTSGFPINREKMMDLLAFEGLVENSYDAIGGADYVGEIASCVQLAATNLGRVTQDLLLWSTQEFGVLKVSAPYVQISSIMPQKRNPVSLEHMRSLLSSCVGNASAVLTMIHNTPFGDIVDTEDDMQPYAWKSLEILEKMYRLLAAVIGTMEVNKEVLRKRTEGSFATVTELADTLVRTDGLSFRKSHHIVSGVVKKALEQGLAANEITLPLVNEVAIQVIGRELSIDEVILQQSLDPEHFVNIRSLPGGPSPKEMERMITDRKLRLQANRQWLHESTEKCEAALQHLDEVITEWSK
ncbi:argininosuccinate lyase [Paenibacillus sp. N1-5-1-14]|uniref:argininosuccinate lyase n=1 Tax=Paenibacillus radicibacter TaxID=2972488 RepID=UPI002158B627|nr:argininosuccinate lyase [Paenibacillus radicibacter]MCR8644000.1 argininosuccinate lyase [Paenibacillus radicibacter]